MKSIARAGVGVMVLNEKGQVLLGKRHDDPEKADSDLSGEGTWTMPGGKLDFGESFEDAAKRELYEETDIKVKNPKVICVMNNKVTTAHYATIGLLVENCKEKPKVMEPDEITEWKWFDLDSLPSPMYFPSARVIENYSAGKFYLKRD